MSSRLSAERFLDQIDELQQTITELRRQLAAQRKYLEELEKQLEYCNPGIVKEVREFLEQKEAK